MVQVISNLGGPRSSISPTAVVRPILVSLAFTVVLPLACQYFVKPLTLLLNRHRENNPSGVLQKVLCHRQTAFVTHTAILLGLVICASYAGTSNLLAAYIAGAIISWWDSELPHPTHSSTASTEASPGQGKNSIAGPSNSQVVSKEEHPDGSERERQDKSTPAVGSSNVCSLPMSGSAVYERYYQQLVEKILKPFFFASIGFSIPITWMFSGPIVWRGIIYALLMTFSKLVCGLWLVRFHTTPLVASKLRISSLELPALPHLRGKHLKEERAGTNPCLSPAPSSALPQCSMPAAQQIALTAASSSHSQPNHQSPKPLSLYPASILGVAMVARGEIGFLISAVAESNGIFGSSSTGDSEIFLVVTWAIVLCTIIGPLGVGLLVRRVRRLESCKGKGTKDVLGVWGVR